MSHVRLVTNQWNCWILLQLIIFESFVHLKQKIVWTQQLHTYHITPPTTNHNADQGIRLNFQPSLDSEDDFSSGCWNVSHHQNDLFHPDDQIQSKELASLH